MLTLLLLICGLAAFENDDAATIIHVDRIDVNHVYRWDGSVVLDQLILWRWSRHDQRFYAVGWSMLRGGRTTDDAAHRRRWDCLIAKAHEGNTFAAWPKYKGKWVGCRQVPRWNGSKWVSRLERNGVWYEVRADAYMETYTTEDPEAVNRRRHPNIKRDVWK